ncbi:MAG: hypothetical protein R3E50_07650 [Halioglobus sp.]
MKTTSIPATALSLLLTTCALPALAGAEQEAGTAASAANGQEPQALVAMISPPAQQVPLPETGAETGQPGANDAGPEEEPTAAATNRQEERAYAAAIQELESSEGAYAEALPESLFSLARNLQSQGRHEEAIKLFKRGAHLTRINEGLYCPQQIPLVQGEIASYIASENYTLADERQSYLYRVEMQLESGDARTLALLQQAKWQYSAYQLGLSGPQGYTRLMNMWELYRQALDDVTLREGKTSPKLLPPLHGMLQAQYLISGYEYQDSDQVFTEDGRVNESLLQFKAYRAQSYQLGSDIIQAISGLAEQQGTQTSETRAQGLVMLGDWRLWNGRREDAWQAYREAETELAREDDAQAELDQLFGEPVALPALEDLSPLPPAVDPAQADVLLAFGVSENGRVRDLERMDDNEAEDRQASRLMRQLRKTTFRPRFEAGQPVETEKLVKAFSIQ